MPHSSVRRPGERPARRAPGQMAQRSRTPPTVKPAPTEASSTRSPFFSRPSCDAVVERERNRGGRGVAEPLEVDDDLRRVDPEAVGGGGDDPAVGLVRHEQGDVVGGQVVPLHDDAADLLRLAHGELEDGLAVLFHEVQPLLHRLAAWPACRLPPAGMWRNCPPLPSISWAKSRIASAGSFAGADDDGAGAVAEQHARRAVGVVDDARHHVGADDERVVVAAGGDELAGGGQREGEAGAGARQVESPRVRGADLVLDRAPPCSGRTCRASSCRR